MPRYPDLREVYSLLTASGFDRLGERNEWIADVSRRMNAGAARWSVIYGGEKLAACACALFVVDSAVFLGCVAAREDMRGRGLGSEAVLTLADRYASEGRRAELFCKDGSIVEFYKNRASRPSADGPNTIQNRKYNMEQTFFKFDDKILKASERALERAEHSFSRIERNTEYNQQKVLSAFIENRVSESHFTETTGYGYGDRGRETLDKVLQAHSAPRRRSCVTASPAAHIRSALLSSGFCAQAIQCSASRGSPMTRFIPLSA